MANSLERSVIPWLDPPIHNTEGPNISKSNPMIIIYYKCEIMFVCLFVTLYYTLYVLSIQTKFYEFCLHLVTIRSMEKKEVYTSTCQFCGFFSFFNRLCIYNVGHRHCSRFADYERADIINSGKNCRTYITHRGKKVLYFLFTPNYVQFKKLRPRPQLPVTVQVGISQMNNNYTNKSVRFALLISIQFLAASSPINLYETNKLLDVAQDRESFSFKIIR